MMCATTDDLALSVRPNGQRRSYSDSFKPKGEPNRQSAGHKIRPSNTSPFSDSADEIQVIEEQQTAIPIRAGLDRRQSDRHLDLDIGSVHARKRRPSPLFERRKRDDLDLLGDYTESSDDDDDDDDASSDRIAPIHNVRGRERHTKPLLHPKQTTPPHRPQRYDYNVAKKHAHYAPQLGHHTSRECSPHGRLPLTELDNEPFKVHSSGYLDSVNKLGLKHHRPTSSPALSSLEHEAMVFDNFEDASPITSASSDQGQDGKDPFDAHLHFVRPAMPICANPGAFVALEPIVAPAGSPNEAVQQQLGGDAAGDGGIDAQRKRHRLGHHRAVSELFSPTRATGLDARATRRRATVGSDAVFRLPVFQRRQSDVVREP